MPIISLSPGWQQGHLLDVGTVRGLDGRPDSRNPTNPFIRKDLLVVVIPSIKNCHAQPRQNNNEEEYKGPQNFIEVGRIIIVVFFLSSVWITEKKKKEEFFFFYNKTENQSGGGAEEIKINT